MQAIEFQTILQNGIINIPSQYSPQWEGKTILLIGAHPDDDTYWLWWAA